jgi:nitrous oxidase accessory protein
MTKKVIPLIAAIVLLAQLLVVVLPVNAASRTIVVPGDYSTIVDAIANAENGDTVFIRAGTYEGPINQTIVINKTLSIVGEDASNTIINFHPQMNVTWFYTAAWFSYSDAITVNADDFGFCNLTISPNGFISINGDRARISGNNITSGSETGLRITGSHCNVTDNTSGGSISLGGYFNRIAQNTFYRIAINQDLNIIDNNAVNTVVLSNSSKNTISNNHIISKTSEYGIDIAGDSCKNEIFGNSLLTLLADLEIVSSTARNNTIYHNNFLSKYHNGPVSLYTYNATLVNFWDNGKEGNYWANFNGSDVNGDGIGDTPYIIDANNVDHYPLMQPWTDSLPAPNSGFNQILLVAIAVVFLGAVLVVLAFFLRKRNSGFQLGSKSIA